MIYILNLDKTMIRPFDIKFVKFVRNKNEIVAEENNKTISLAKYEDEKMAENAMAELLSSISKGCNSFEFKKYEKEMTIDELLEKIDTEKQNQ